MSIANDQRFELAKTWLASQSKIPEFSIEPLAGDASFRRYFRVIETNNPNQSYVLMDAPPGKEDVTPFIQICDWLSQSGIHTPRIMIQDQKQGFLLLEDFGDVTWSTYMETNQDINALFEDALSQIHTLQAATTNLQLPIFNLNRMQTEANLYLDWYLPYVRESTPSQPDRDNFHIALLPLLTTLDQLPKAPVHLDYHSRNLMISAHGLPLGVIDFQDAVHGPITYDLASLLYDCYQDYPEQERIKWSKQFFNALDETQQSYFNHDFEQWHQALRLTALQRHIKAIGIFSRLAFRDGKKQFLDEIPLTKKHLNDELQALALQVPFLND